MMRSMRSNWTTTRIRRSTFFKVDDVALLQKAAKRCRKFGRYEAYVTASYRRDNASSPEVCYHFDDNEFL